MFTGGVVLDIVFVIFRGDQSVYIHEGAESQLSQQLCVCNTTTDLVPSNKHGRVNQNILIYATVQLVVLDCIILYRLLYKYNYQYNKVATESMQGLAVVCQLCYIYEIQYCFIGPYQCFVSVIPLNACSPYFTQLLSNFEIMPQSFQFLKVFLPDDHCINFHTTGTTSSSQ